MKKFLYLLVVVLFGGQVAAQQEASNWFFGYNAGATFTQNSAIARGDGKMQSEEGCATISDSRGSLLFYSNGRLLLNRAHNTLKNSNGLLGDRSSTQNVLIIPQPGNDSIYFVCTVSAMQSPDGGLFYSIVNMHGDNGFGEVIQKNIPLVQDCFEKITAVRHCNNSDVWVTVRKWNSDEYYSYLVGAMGIGSPVISHTGFTVGGVLTSSVGAIKFSAKGNKLAGAFGYAIDKVELLDFNNQTGLLSNGIVFTANSYNGPLDFSGNYGIEFSPDSRLLYVSAYNNVDEPAMLYQFNIVQWNEAAIVASRQIISNNIFGAIGNLQLAINGKIYIALPGKSNLAVIHEPDRQGAACNFQADGLAVLIPGLAQSVKLGLPTFIQSYFDQSYVPYDFISTQGSCLDHNLYFSINRLNGIDSLHWDFGDGTVSTVLSAGTAHYYSSPGRYDVKLSVHRQGCWGMLQM